MDRFDLYFHRGGGWKEAAKVVQWPYQSCNAARSTGSGTGSVRVYNGVPDGWGRPIVPGSGLRRVSQDSTGDLCRTQCKALYLDRVHRTGAYTRFLKQLLQGEGLMY